MDAEEKEMSNHEKDYFEGKSVRKSTTVHERNGE